MVYAQQVFLKYVKFLRTYERQSPEQCLRLLNYDLGLPAGTSCIRKLLRKLHNQNPTLLRFITN